MAHARGPGRRGPPARLPAPTASPSARAGLHRARDYNGLVVPGAPAAGAASKVENQAGRLF